MSFFFKKNQLPYLNLIMFAFLLAHAIFHLTWFPACFNGDCAYA